MPSLKGTSQNVVESMISTSLSSMPWKNADLALTNIDKHKDYKEVLEKFDSFFQVRKNVMYEIARFNRRSQQSGETAEQYIMVVYDLTENDDYGDRKEEMICNHLVVSI